jgi:hydrogenase maturation protease
MECSAGVIGYGNELRRDDGIGPRVAREVLARGLAGVEVREAHQLLPEHAEWLAGLGRVVFVDASIDSRGVETRCLKASREARLAPHASDPEALLALAGALFGNAPEAWLVTVAAADLGLGEGLSAAAERQLPEAVAAVLRALDGGVRP